MSYCNRQMPDCDYCGESFGSERAELEHLEAEHRDELGPIDRRRIGDVDDDGEGLPTGPIALGAVLVAAAAVVAYVIFVGGGGGTGTAAGQPYDLGSVHYHGTINATIDGQQLDFSRPRFQNPQEYPAFHFEGGDGSIWHVHARGVTLGYAMNTLGINVTDSSVTYDGTTYRDSDPEWEVIVQVDGQDVDPDEFVLGGATDEQAARQGEGQHIRIVVREA